MNDITTHGGSVPVDQSFQAISSSITAVHNSDEDIRDERLGAAVT